MAGYTIVSLSLKSNIEVALYLATSRFFAYSFVWSTSLVSGKLDPFPLKIIFLLIYFSDTLENVRFLSILNPNIAKEMVVS